ncbi:hypothetical protein OG21DRAFT_1478933 [Imleria badia]|nr:hypothetical protein OG21DRAFT_1478933 [Imleria badia]
MLDRILEVIGTSWADSTKELYGTGLLIFHVYCDIHNIAEVERCPISRALLLSFLSSCTGSYSGSAISNYAVGIRAWHLLHGHPWNIDQDELHIKIICSYLNLDDLCDAAIYACMVVVFYCVVRLGEFMVKAVKVFNPDSHVTWHNFVSLFNKDNLPVLQFTLPKTKCKPVKEEAVQCAPQSGCIMDPEAAIRNHFRINPAAPSDHLFAWKHLKGSLRPLSKTQYTTRIIAIVKQCGLVNLQGHSLRIGGTLFYLLKGVPFDAIKVMGCWKGDVFMLYLRHHTLILAPFLQAEHQILDNFNRIAMLLVC